MNITLPSNDPDLQQLVYVKTNIGGFFFDAILQLNHNSSLTITEHPVEVGAAISDHAYMNPDELTLLVGMTDVARSLVEGQFSQGHSRSVTAYQTLLELQKQRIPLQVVTRLKTYNNMLIKQISAPDDNKSVHGLRATVMMKEIFVASVQIVKISARPQATDSTNKGNTQPVQPNQSILFQIGTKFGIDVNSLNQFVGGLLGTK